MDILSQKKTSFSGSSSSRTTKEITVTSINVAAPLINRHLFFDIAFFFVDIVCCALVSPSVVLLLPSRAAFFTSLVSFLLRNVTSTPSNANGAFKLPTPNLKNRMRELLGVSPSRGESRGVTSANADSSPLPPPDRCRLGKSSRKCRPVARLTQKLNNHVASVEVFPT